ncbi:MAG: flagellin, partial [Candidatus Kapabacteria bacterium]|nr:flagellin [Candidatus Kapabacteria bacterium]
MPSAITNGARIRTNTPAENAYNALDAANRDIALHQLRLSTGKRINSAQDDVAGYITSRALKARNGALQAALNAVGDASSVTNIAQDGLDNISSLLQQIKDAASTASSGALGTDEKVALAKSAYRLAQQIQTIVDSTVFGGRQLLNGTFSAEFVIGTGA